MAIWCTFEIITIVPSMRQKRWLVQAPGFLRDEQVFSNIFIKMKNYTSAVRSITRSPYIFFYQNSDLQAACDSSIALVTGCVCSLQRIQVGDSPGSAKGEQD